MKFNKKITLLKLKAGTGRAEPTEEARAQVWADVSDIGVTTKYAALSAGQEATLQVLMWRREFDAAGRCGANAKEGGTDAAQQSDCPFTHAEYGGKRYKIAQTGSAANPLHIKLILERG